MAQPLSPRAKPSCWVFSAPADGTSAYGITRCQSRPSCGSQTVGAPSLAAVESSPYPPTDRSPSSLTKNSTVLWSSSSLSASGSLSSPVAQLLDDGNFVIQESGSSSSDRFWQSFDYPTDTLLPGMKLGWNLTSGLNRNLTAWTSETDPAPSGYTMGMDLDGYPEIFLWTGTTKKWRAGSWNGLRFSGIPEMKGYDKLYWSINKLFVEHYILYYP
ncbi:receptor-like serine/threonine-protein kinase SD1-8 [Zingiber officinale]|uniref:Bulb-type lectin domain-containing protein n=1 Tax=Zingiber officinale TaxID=94328 RepID=A0A8J5F2V9_ZINOF|nr:receptor-like serine/threonine-protein kinase SD1-8 [Zingiber officinale]KAG6480595.1 hypothetical protein ZIOFF_057179 [Zingiber officinale]